MNNHFKPFALLVVASMLGACAAPPVRKPAWSSYAEVTQAIAATAGVPPLVEAHDSLIDVALDTVVVRNGEGSWAKDAYWDEYRLRVRSYSGRDLEVQRIRLFDVFGRPIESSAERSHLIDATREIEKEYWKRKKYASQLGQGAHNLASVAFHALNPYSIIPILLFIAPAMIVDDAINSVQVSDELKRRQTILPAKIDQAYTPLVAFFPIVPWPSAIEISYRDGDEEGRLTIATRSLLAETHPYRQPAPQYPALALHRGIEEGFVKANLSIDAEGDVTRVDIVETSSSVFVQEAKVTLANYKYPPGAEARTVQEVIRFKRFPKAM